MAQAFFINITKENTQTLEIIRRCFFDARIKTKLDKITVIIDEVTTEIGEIDEVTELTIDFSEITFDVTELAGIHH